jgi:N-acetylneuraminic acid mutarotase
MSIPRSDHTATLLPDGRVLVIGGGFFPTKPTELYDPATNTWAEQQHGPDAEPIGAGGQVIGKKLYLVGGSYVFNAIEHSAVQSYDPAVDSWAYPTPQSMPTPRTFLTVAVANGNLYALGGSNDAGVLATNEVYTP